MAICLCFFHSNCALLKTWTVVTWRAVTPPRCILLQATTVWLWWNTCCIMGPTCTLKIKGTIIFIWISVTIVALCLNCLIFTCSLSFCQRSGSFAQCVFVRSLRGGRVAGETWSICERGGPLEVHTTTWGCSQGQIWDLQTTAQGLIHQMEKSCTCWHIYYKYHDCVGIKISVMFSVITSYHYALIIY